MYKIKFLDLVIYNNLRAVCILISSTVFEIQGLEKSQKNTPYPKFRGNFSPTVLSNTKSRFPVRTNILNVF